MKVRKIGIVSRYDKADAREMVKTLVDHFKDKISIAVTPNSASYCKITDAEIIPVEKMREEGVDLIVSIGGDGTVLRTISKMEDPLPLLGIHMGTLGFLVDTAAEDAIPTIEKILDGFEYEERKRLKVMLNRKELPSATNEVVLTTARPAKIITFRITVDHCIIEEIRADGVVIATPTGSTAYAMSAGGPLIDPRVNATLIVPLAPFRLSARPWVVPSDRSIQVEIIVPEKEAAIVIDGQHNFTMKMNDVITLTEAPNPARFVSTGITGFYQKVESKLR
ncbi:NAD(+)/NADH kinase [Methanohalophilus sp.]|uniref:NAD(+)/NADH kinase n=1 Tax=Methanohalophilus sp. TaxID=1966352 RepID=UPI00262A5CA3|nr:NAD(+)/NADH kinase [Methanohalophilus sp.]MDK2891709.1 kinase [Methanohalophilus sp.]